MELIKLEDITKEDFQTFEPQEDYITQADCEDCGESYEEEVEECAVCGSDNIINETSHEGLRCEACRHYFDMWEDTMEGYVGEEPVAICNACYEKLEEFTSIGGTVMTTKQLTYQSSNEIITALEDSSFQTLMGKNVDGETVIATLIDDPTLEDNYSITTYQTNGHVRINYYNGYGNPTGETYEGKWK